jgi:hypothetical protein
MWDQFIQQTRSDHEGLLSNKVALEKAKGQFACALGFNFWQTKFPFVCPIWNKHKVTVAHQDPVHFSLSVREVPPDEAQTSTGDGPDKKKDDPRPGLRQAIRQDIATFELNVSAVINSASVEDRLNYIAAYVLIPPLPGSPAARANPEWYFLKRFRGIQLTRKPIERARYERQDLRLALQDLRVRIEKIERVEGENKPIDMGTLTGTGNLSAQAGASTTEGLKIVGIQPSIGFSVTENMKRELAKRSNWIDEHRSLLRVTQRGMAEANVSGTITNLITIHVPRIPLYEIVPSEEAMPTLRSVGLPLYKEIAAIGMVLGTVRIAIPDNEWFFKQREFDGVAYTHVEPPQPLRLSQFRRGKVLLKLQDLLPDLKNTTQGESVMGMFITDPDFSRQNAIFGNSKSHQLFVDSIIDDSWPARYQKLKLVRHHTKNWYLVAPCFSNKPPTIETKEMPEHGEIWLGFEDNDMDLEGKQFRTLPKEIGKCS